MFTLLLLSALGPGTAGGHDFPECHGCWDGSYGSYGAYGCYG
jgi:hypothetical protein